MNNNLQSVFQIMRSGGNPKTLLMNMIQQQSSNNPIMRNVYDMANANNAQGIESLARNICKEKGINPDEMMKNIKSQFGA